MDDNLASTEGKLQQEKTKAQTFESEVENLKRKMQDAKQESHLLTKQRDAAIEDNECSAVGVEKEKQLLVKDKCALAEQLREARSACKKLREV